MRLLVTQLLYILPKNELDRFTRNFARIKPRTQHKHVEWINCGDIEKPTAINLYTHVILCELRLYIGAIKRRIHSVGRIAAKGFCRGAHVVICKLIDIFDLSHFWAHKYSTITTLLLVEQSIDLTLFLFILLALLLVSICSPFLLTHTLDAPA